MQWETLISLYLDILNWNNYTNYNSKCYNSKHYNVPNKSELNRFIKTVNNRIESSIFRFDTSNVDASRNLIYRNSTYRFIPNTYLEYSGIAILADIS